MALRIARPGARARENPWAIGRKAVMFQNSTSNLLQTTEFQTPNNRAWALAGFRGWSFLRRAACALLLVSPLLARGVASSDALFIAGTQAFKEADFERSAAAFR